MREELKKLLIEFGLDSAKATLLADEFHRRALSARRGSKKLSSKVSIRDTYHQDRRLMIYIKDVKEFDVYQVLARYLDRVTSYPEFSNWTVSKTGKKLMKGFEFEVICTTPIKDKPLRFRKKKQELSADQMIGNLSINEQKALLARLLAGEG